MLPLPSLGPPRGTALLFGARTEGQVHARSMQVNATFSAKMALRALKMHSRQSKSPPRGFQETFLAPSASVLQFGPCFCPVWVPKATSRINECCQTSLKFCDFALFSSSRLRDPILDPPGLRFGSLLAFKMPPRPSQERPRHAQERPRGLQDRPKSAHIAARPLSR